MCVVLQAQVEGIQEHAEELLAQKDIESQQAVEQIEAECQALLNKKDVEAKEANAKMMRRIRDSGQCNDLFHLGGYSQNRGRIEREHGRICE
jgi:hypothetical protein